MQKHASRMREEMFSSSEPARKTKVSTYQLGYIEVYTTLCGKLTATSSNQAPNSEVFWDYGICQTNTYFVQQQLKSFIMQMYLVFLRSSIIDS